MLRAPRWPLMALPWLGLWGWACDGGSAESAAVGRPEAGAHQDAHASSTEDSDEPAESDEADDADVPAVLPETGPGQDLGNRDATPTEPPGPEPDESPTVLERRRAGRALMVYTAPTFGTPFRGKIPRGHVFEVLEYVEGPECGGDGWGRVGTAAFACLHRTEPVDDPAVVLPETLPDGLAPFLYARLQKRGSTTEPTPAPRWRSRRAMRAGAPPQDHLQPEHDYAFVRRRRARGGALLLTEGNRVVREADVHRMKPSPFAGRELGPSSIPAGTQPAWSIMWPHAAIHPSPTADPDAEPLHRLSLHAEALVRDEPQTHRGHTWLPTVEPVEGWVRADVVRWWTPLPPPADVGASQVWLDVDLDQQMLALRRGTEVEFLTLVSSGNWKHATPTGLFRLESKWAYADMRSRPDDADDPYHVEGVPWVLYFRGRYALHGTFWHNRFGRRTSHGCINLSAKDARYVFEHTAPVARPGWLVTYEHGQEEGTLLRIRKGTTPPPDRRRAPRSG